MANATVGTLSVEIKNLLDLQFAAGAPILIGPGNIRHMLSRHPYEYAKYGESTPSIVKNPDYVGINTKDGSIEYIKEYPQEPRIHKSRRKSLLRGQPLREIPLRRKRRQNPTLRKLR